MGISTIVPPTMLIVDAIKKSHQKLIDDDNKKKLENKEMFKNKEKELKNGGFKNGTNGNFR